MHCVRSDLFPPPLLRPRFPPWDRNLPWITQPKLALHYLPGTRDLESDLAFEDEEVGMEDDRDGINAMDMGDIISTVPTMLLAHPHHIHMLSPRLFTPANAAPPLMMTSLMLNGRCPKHVFECTEVVR